MKFLRSLLAIVALLVASLSSNAINFSIFIDDAATIKMTANDVPVQLKNGMNNLSYSEWTNIVLEGVNPYIISEIVDEAGQEWAILSSSWSKSLYTTDEGKTFYISVRNLDETRTGSFTVTVDDATKVKAVMEGSYLEIPLKNGVNELKFDPKTETSLIITSPIYEYVIYKVTLNGVEDPGYYGNFFVPLSDGCHIDIQANYPDIDCNITFTYSDNQPGFITLLSVDGQFVDFNGTDITCKAGSQVLIYANQNYDFRAIYINGEKTQWDENNGSRMPLRIPTKGDVKIYIDANPYKVLNVYVKCTDPSQLILFNGYTVELNYVDLPSAECTIQIPENNPLLTWLPAKGCTVDAVYVDGDQLEDGRDWYGVSDGTYIEFVTSAKTTDIDFVFWVDNREGLYFFNLENAERKHYDTEVVNGYNQLSTYSAGNPLTLAWYGDNVVSGLVFINDKLQSPLYADTWNYSLQVADQDVIKLFLATDPTYCDVNFDIEDGVHPIIKKDIITTVTGTETTVLTDTQFNITSPDSMKVFVNGDEVEAQANGAYVFTVTDDTNVKIEKGDNSAVLTVAGMAAEAPVYNMQGICVGKSVDQLPAGLYIRNGRKFVVK